MKKNINTLYADISQYREKKSPALYFRGKAISYQTLLKRVDNMANILADQGIQKDSVVTLLSPNIPETIIAFYALNKIGAVVSLLHPLIPPKLFTDAVRDTSSRFVILFEGNNSPYQNELKTLNQKVLYLSMKPDLGFFGKKAYKGKIKSELPFVDKSKVILSTKRHKIKMPFTPNTDSEKPSVYLQSGGTTGHGKSIILSDSALRFPGAHATEILCHPLEGLTMIGVLPLFHGFGLAMGIHAPLMNGATTNLMLKFSPKEITKAIKKDQLNVLITIPYMAEKLLSYKPFNNPALKNLVMTFIGADKPNQTLFENFDSMMIKRHSENRLYEGYGLTETVTVCCVNTLDNHCPGSVGKPLSGVKVRIVNPKNRAKEMPLGQDGEILISGPCNCLGYLNLPDRQQPFFTDQNNVDWICTRDIGHVDQNGYLYFKNRETDMIKIAGYEVYPSEIETLANEVNGVVNACAIYMDGSHPYIRLYIENHLRNGDELRKDVLAHLKERLYRYAVPEQIVILPRFPRTAMGKTDRKALIHF